MIEIRRLDRLRRQDLRLAPGYTSEATYQATKSETFGEFRFSLMRQQLDAPYVKQWPDLDEDFRHLSQVVTQGLSLGAYDDDQLVGIAISEKREWNSTLWVWEFAIAESHRRQGLGRQLMERVSQAAKTEGMLIVVCETQNTNAPAIDFYRSIGFEVDGIDLSYYGSSHVGADSVAVFMKRKLEWSIDASG